MTEEPLHWLTIGELGRAFRSGALSPTEATERMLERIERLDSRLHAYLRTTPALALSAAAEAEAELRAGHDRGPLHGVPIGLKDLVATKAAPTSAGMAILRDHVPAEDASVVERLRRAGAVILGKLCLTEGAYAEHHPSIPPPVNPWNPGRWPGVSSSGSGVAVAAGLCFGALGTDTGGSIRFPSAANGIVGIKPTYGRVSRHGVFPLAPSLDHVGPMARTVADAAILLRAIAGPDPKDPTSLCAPVPDYLAGLDRGIEGVRIGVDESYVREGMDAGIAAAVLEAAALFRDSGARVREIRMPPHEEVVRYWPIVCAAEVAVVHEAYYPARAEEYGPGLRALLEAGRTATARDYARAHEARLRFCGALAALFEEVDLILCPSLGLPVPEAKAEIRAEDEALVAKLLRFTAPFDFSGNPTISLPCGFSPDGMPVSLQLVGRHLQEGLLCRVASVYERSTPWHRRHPPLGE